MLLIPAIDIKEGRCVRLRRGDLSDETLYDSDPIQAAARWVSQGAKRLHLVDLDGAVAGQPVNASIIQKIVNAYPDVPLQVGGGIRNVETVKAYLDAGVRYVIIGTQAVNDPAFVSDLCQQFPGHIIVGIDAKKGLVATDGWAEISEVKATDLAKKFEYDGVSAIIYTDIDRDGMMQGVNIESTVKMAKASPIPVIASGGITNMDDILALNNTPETSIFGAITGRAIYEGTLDISDAQKICDEQSKK